MSTVDRPVRRPEAHQFASSKAFAFAVFGLIVHVALTLLMLAVLHSPAGWWVPTPLILLIAGAMAVRSNLRSAKETGGVVFWTPLTLRYMWLFGSAFALGTFVLNYLIFGRGAG